MNKYLSFDSSFIISPFREIYIFIIKIFISFNKHSKNKLFLCRLDKNDVFLKHELNVSDTATSIDKYGVDAQSVKFYRNLKKLNIVNKLKIANESLYELYPRQVKLKLGGVVKCVHKIQKILEYKSDKIEIITDFQTAEVFKQTFSFLNFSTDKIYWNTSFILSLPIILNSIAMRFLAFIKFIFVSSKLPKEYFYKYVNRSSPTIILTMPMRKPEYFFESYISKFKRSNIVLYSCGKFNKIPKEYQIKKVKSKTNKIIKGFFNFKNIGFNLESYITDILLIYKDHADLTVSIDIVNEILSHKVDAVISRNQTLPLEVYLVKKAKEKNIFILADLMEEVYYCDAIACPTKFDLHETAKLALVKNGKILIKKRNDLIKYRLKNFNESEKNYLHDKLKLDKKKKLIFYASNPMKNDERQRYLTEKFLINYFSLKEEFILIIKTHRQDIGKVTSTAYEDNHKPSNVILIGDINLKRNFKPNNFKFFDNFDFNSAIKSSNGFLTISSTSILQAIMLNIKAGVIDTFNYGHHKNLIKLNVVKLINNYESLEKFLENADNSISEQTLNNLGLNIIDLNNDFDLEKELFKLLSKN